jgi:uncharacterized repeat protein (TIGR03803 family)
MVRNSSFRKRNAARVLLAFGVLLGAAWAQNEGVLYSFCGQNNCTDGENPQAGLIFDQEGNLYGIAGGGANDACGRGNNVGCGVVFKLTPGGEETVLYSFCAQSNCADGASPYAGLVFDRRGNLYGTTQAGGAFGAGVVFKLTPKGRETVLYSFCAQNNCTDGYNPVAGLIFDEKGNLYGTAEYGGAYGDGVVFKLTPEGKETVLHSFCQYGYPCADGEEPVAGLVFDQKRNLYGTTEYGGRYNELCNGTCGVVFKLTPKGKEIVLHSFCEGAVSCIDGATPLAGLVFDQKGNLYGTTSGGGNYEVCPGNGCGVAFKLTPKGKEIVLHRFCAQNNCTDGLFPLAGLVPDQKGNLYGTTLWGGHNEVCYGHGCGVVFKLTPKGKELVLHSFCEGAVNCTDGWGPVAGLIFDKNGNLYGTTEYGGAYSGCYGAGCGVVFKLTP